VITGTTSKQTTTMGCAGIFFGWIIPFIILTAATFVGWLSTEPQAFSQLFATILPLQQLELPPLLFGHGKMKGVPTVPDDMKPEPRPENELFLTLPGGYQMPQSGIGMCCRATAYDDVLVRRTILWYLLLGGRQIDTAQLYLNHRAIGLGIQDAMERGVPRSEIFVTTKVAPAYFGYNTTMATVPTFLEELRLEHIDLVLMHMPSFPLIRNECSRSGTSNQKCRQETWKALSEHRDKGLVRNIGVSNFAPHHMKDIQELGLAPIANNQFLWNPFASPLQHEILEYCQAHGIATTSYFSLGGTAMKNHAAEIETLQAMATKYGVSLYKLLLRWSVQQGFAVIPGTGKPPHMKDNLSVYSFEISAEDMEIIGHLKDSTVAPTFQAMEVGKMFD